MRSLRDAGYDGRITLVGAEPALPYDRPVLSKAFLTGADRDAPIGLCEDGVVAEGVELRLGVSATALDLEARTLTLEDGSQLDFSGLIVATGARARRIPHFERFAGVHTLRGIEDARAIRAAFDAHPARVAVIGAGFIGAEVAAAARSRGLEVTLIEPLAAPCVRGLGERMGGALADLYRANGVDLRLGVAVADLEGNGRVERVRLNDGSLVEAQLVIVGVGAVPNVEFLAGSGVPVDDGVVCDCTGLAAPGVTAAGDVARRPSRFGGTLRIEHWDNAIAGGSAAARRLLVADADATSFDPVPWFWSDQFDWNVQLAGHPGTGDHIELVTGTLGKPPFAAVYVRGGRPTGFVGVNAGALVRKARKLLARDAPLASLRALGAA